MYTNTIGIITFYIKYGGYNMKKIIFFVYLVVTIIIIFVSLSCNKKQSQDNKQNVAISNSSLDIKSSASAMKTLDRITTDKTNNIIKLSHSHHKYQLSKNLFLSYEFNDKVKIGTVIFKVSLYDSNNNKITNYQIFVSISMPDMPGAHDSSKIMSVNKNNIYLAPLDFVMRGYWEISLRIADLDGKENYEAVIDINI